MSPNCVGPINLKNAVAEILEDIIAALESIKLKFKILFFKKKILLGYLP